MNRFTEKPTSVRRKQSKEPEELNFYEISKELDINDENWRCVVIMLVETHKSETKYTSMLNSESKNGYRKAIHVINNDMMLNSLNAPVTSDLSTAEQQNTWSSLQKLRECAQAAVKEGSSFEAGLVKWAVYEARLEALAKRAAELEEATEREREFLAMQQPGPLAKDGPATGAATRKPYSKLRLRGEEWRDRVYVDDAPLDGPDLYILLTGFYDPGLPLELIEFGVPLKCILRLENHHLDSCTEFPLNATNFGVVDSSEYFSPMQSRCTCSASSKSSVSESLGFWERFDGEGCCDVAIRSYCPSWSSDVEPSQIYDAVSYMMYDVHDTVRLHDAYLASMRLLEVHEPRDGASMLREYGERVQSVPEHCASVHVVLEAMLRQFEDSEDEGEGGEENGDPSETEEAASCRQVDRGELALSKERLSLQLHLLNLKCELVTLPAAPSERRAPELILHGDALQVDACRASPNHEQISGDLASLLRQPRIEHAWQTAEREHVERCCVHLPGIMKCCRKEGIDPSKVKHLLNILGLRKIIKSRFTKQSLPRDPCDDSKEIISNVSSTSSYCRRRSNISIENDNQSKKSIGRQGSFTLDGWSARRNLPSVHRANVVGSASTLRSQFRHRVASRGTLSIDAGQLLHSFEACPGLFSLMDARESLGLREPSSDLRDLGYAELLGQRAFLQIVADCLLSFEAVVLEHFAPTDSLLLAFGDEPIKEGEVLDRRTTCAVRTPVCLRDFCDYVMEEEGCWLKRQRQGSEENLRHRIVLSGFERGEPLFRDEDFLLPGSIKAQQFELLDTPDNQPFERTSLQRKSFARSRSHQSLSYNQTSRNSFNHQDDGFEFIGYEMGERRRVQVTNLNKSYEACDGTRLQLMRDAWLLGVKGKMSNTSIKISRPEDGHWGLRYHENNSKAGRKGMFHVTANNGIIVAFSKLCYANLHGTKLSFELQISWPSGLIIKPVEIPDVNYPFFILQHYTSKGPGCESIINETHRKYLHNGDIVKFFIDGSVTVLRLNGSVYTNIGLGRGNQDWRQESEGSENCFSECVELDRGISGLYRKTSSSLSYSFERETTKPLHYTVLEPDGRFYEVFDGEITRELDRIRTRTAEGYDPEEKFHRRADGTDMLFTADAELIIDFPDGTRTLLGCRFAKETVECDWSAAELDSMFGGESPEKFVLVETFSQAEHPNYATVIRNGELCTLTMGQSGPRVELEPRATGIISLCDDRVHIELAESEVTTRRKCCRGCSVSSSVASIPLEPSPTLLTLRDHAREVRVARDDASFTVCPRTEANNCRCEHSRDDEPRQRRRPRLFALSRNGDACEYQRRSSVNKWEYRIAEDQASSLVCPTVHQRLTLEPLTSVLGQALDWKLRYKIGRARPRKRYRYPEDEENKAKWDEPLSASCSEAPAFLIARLQETVGENCLVSMQKALVRYWREIATTVREGTEEKTTETCEICTDAEKQLRDIVRGRVRTIDLEIYEAGREYLRKRKVEWDEEQTRRLIDRSYRGRPDPRRMFSEE